jgi:microcystin-dependent protein
MKKILLFFVIVFFSSTTTVKAQAEPYIGQISIYAFNFAPRGWMPCDGRLLHIAQYQALFALIGTTYGGNGVTTFALPDLRGRIVVVPGNGPGLTPKTLGEMGGTETNTLLISNLPPHNHSINAVSTEGNQNSPTGNLPADTKTLDKEYSNAAANTTMKTSMVGNTGNGTPVNNMQPYLSIGYYIATEGIFPPRD